MSKSTKNKRDAQFKKQTKMADDDPKAYRPAPGDANAETRPSKFTTKFKDMFTDEFAKENVLDRTRDRHARENEAEKRSDARRKRRHDRERDIARIQRVRQINRRSDGTN